MHSLRPQSGTARGWAGFSRASRTLRSEEQGFTYHLILVMRMHTSRLKSRRSELFEIGVASEVSHLVGFNFRAVLLLLTFSLLNAVASQAQALQPTAGAMQGTVSIAGGTDQTPVSGATIAVFGETSVSSTVSDREGKFSFSGLAPGIYVLEARYLGLRAQQKIGIGAGEIVQVSVQLESPNPTHASQ